MIGDGATVMVDNIQQIPLFDLYIKNAAAMTE
jgi:hypothetical protein